MKDASEDTSALPSNAARHRRRRGRTRGVTMVEVLMSMVLIGTASLGALSGIMFIYRVSDANLRQLGAVAAARAVAEQVATLDFDTLDDATLPVDIPSSSVGSLTANAWNDRTDNIHGTSRTDDDLSLSLRPEITLSDSSTLFSCAQIIIRFRWVENAFFRPRTREDSLTLVMSKAESY